MNQKLLLAIYFLLFFHPKISAQKTFLGVSFSPGISNDVVDPGYIVKSHWSFVMDAGVTGLSYLTPGIFARMGVCYSLRRREYDVRANYFWDPYGPVHKYKYTMHHISVPLILSFGTVKKPEKKTSFYFSAGLDLSTAIGGRTISADYSEEVSPEKFRIITGVIGGIGMRLDLNKKFMVIIEPRYRMDFPDVGNKFTRMHFILLDIEFCRSVFNKQKKEKP